MAQENVGKLNYVVAANTADFTTNLATAEVKVLKFARTTEMSSNRVAAAGGRMRGFSQSMQQLAFAADDAAAVWGTSGFSGAVRAASNNLGMLGAAFGPTGLLVTTLGATLLNVGVTAWNRYSTSVDGATQSQETFLESAKKVVDQAAAMAAKRADVNNLLTPGGRAAVSGERATGVAEGVREEMRKVNADVERSVAVIKQLEQQIREVNTRGGDQSERRAPILAALEEARAEYRALQGVQQETQDRLNRALTAETKARKASSEIEHGQIGTMQKHLMQMQQINATLEERNRLYQQFDNLNKSATTRFEAFQNLNRELSEKLLPDELRKRGEILKQLDETLKVINSLGRGPQQTAALIGKARAVAAQELAKLDQQEQGRQQKDATKSARPRDILPPSAVRGSSEAISAVNRASMKRSANDQTAKNTEKIAKSSAETAKAVKGIEKKSQNPIRLFPGNL